MPKPGPARPVGSGSGAAISSTNPGSTCGPPVVAGGSTRPSTRAAGYTPIDSVWPAIARRTASRSAFFGASSAIHSERSIVPFTASPRSTTGSGLPVAGAYRRAGRYGQRRRERALVIGDRHQADSRRRGLQRDAEHGEELQPVGFRDPVAAVEQVLGEEREQVDDGDARVAGVEVRPLWSMDRDARLGLGDQLVEGPVVENRNGNRHDGVLLTCRR